MPELRKVIIFLQSLIKINELVNWHGIDIAAIYIMLTT